MKMKFLSIAVAAAVLSLGTISAMAQEAWRVVTPAQIKKMNTFERVQYTKALDLLNKNQYRAAATEFEKFKIQHNDSEVLPYILFLRGYSLHQAKDRNAAISVYNEVLDFYGGEIDAAVPALYYRGIAQLDNGDYAKGMQSMKELVDDGDYQKHPLAASASIKLVENLWKNKEGDASAKYLQQIVRDFKTVSPNAAENAENLLIAYYISNAKLKDYESWYLGFYKDIKDKEGKTRTPAQLRADMVKKVCHTIIWRWWELFGNEADRYSPKRKPADVKKELWKFVSDNRQYFEQTDDMWSYYLYSMRTLADRKDIMKDPEFEKLVAECAKYVAGVADDEKNKGRMQKRYAEIVDVLIQGGRYDQALYMNAKLDNRQAAAWNEYVINARQNKWDECIKQLDGIASVYKSDSDFVTKAKWEKAAILKDRLRKFDDAIKVYQEISQPPRTLWEIQECHLRKDDVKSAIAVLIEIESAFPNDGPDAALRRAQIYHSKGNKELCIKECRYVMKKYPDSKASSQTHQILEKYGIDTGGALAD